jgi:formylmethanofuran dehydrogenase subunit E
VEAKELIECDVCGVETDDIVPVSNDQFLCRKCAWNTFGDDPIDSL